MPTEWLVPILLPHGIFKVFENARVTWEQDVDFIADLPRKRCSPCMMAFSVKLLEEFPMSCATINNGIFFVLRDAKPGGLVKFKN